MLQDDLLTYSRAGIAGARADIFAIDGNLAGAAGIAEMLVQSHTGEIVLLPALPNAWPRGSVRGLRCRGGFTIDIAWEHGTLASATLWSLDDAECRVRYRTRAAALRVKARIACTLDGDLVPEPLVDSPFPDPA